MSTALEFMFTPFVACILLISITGYFGIHVIKREIIFIDIALAQIAALGSVIALIFQEADHEHEGHSILAYIFCFLAAILFTLLKNKKIKIPLEAFIGITYAVATTGAVIILDKAAGGDVHVHDMIMGSLLWVSWHQVFRLFIVVVIVGLIHFIFRNNFQKLSDNYLKEDSGLKNPRIWDFLFYFTFGMVIVEAVSIGGILTIFAFLIIPASISALFAKDWFPRILIGLGIGGISAILGMYLSWTKDFPCSPSIILIMGIFLLIAAGYQVAKFVVKKQT